MDPDHHRCGLRYLGRSPDVEREAVLARTVSQRAGHVELRAGRPHLGRGSYLDPRLDGLRRSPPQIADGRRCVGDPEKSTGLSHDLALQRTLDGIDLRPVVVVGRIGRVGHGVKAGVRRFFAGVGEGLVVVISASRHGQERGNEDPNHAPSLFGLPRMLARVRSMAFAASRISASPPPR